MNPRLIRAVIAFYPSDWRRRYGGELEQLILDACGASASRLKTAWLIAGVAAGGLRERIPRSLLSNAPRVAGALGTAVVAGLAVFVVSGADQSNTKALSASPTPMTLARHLHLDPMVKKAYDDSVRYSPGSQQIRLGIDQASGNVDAVIGSPSHTEINPNTMQVVSVRPSPR